MKKNVTILALTLSFLTVFGADFKAGKFYYFINEDLESVTLEKADLTPGDYQLIVPDSVSYNGMKFVVNRIGPRAFAGTYSNYPQTIQLPNTIYYIGTGAFYGCYNLVTINLPNTISVIDAGAFKGCKQLKNIVLPESLTSIGDETFYNCSKLTELNIPNSIVSIGDSAFSNCTSVQELTLGSSLNTLGDNAFSNCSSILSVIIPKSVTSIGVSPFRECSNITCIKVEEGNLFFDSRDNCNAIINTESNTLICGCNYSIIPNTVRIIGDFAFFNCDKMTELVIPTSVSMIGCYSFYKCTGLTMNLDIPDSVNSLGDYAFYGCSHLTSLKIGKSMKELGKFAFHSSGLILVEFNAKKCNDMIVVNDKQSVFPSSIKRFVFGNDVARIPNNICYRMGILSTSLGKNVKFIGDSAFFSCTGLESVIFPDSLKTIGIHSFYSCNLKSLIIPNSVTSIDLGSFFNNKELKSITLSNNLITIGPAAFCNCIIDSLFIPDSVQTIGKSAFGRCKELEYLSIGKNLKKLSDYAFQDCSNLTHLVWNAISCDELGYAPFYNVPGFTLVEFSEGVEIIPEHLCSGLKMESITLPNTIKTIGKSAFRGSALKHIKLPESLISIGDEAFCRSHLESIVIPNSVSNIGFDSFSDCSALTSLTIPSSLTELCENFNGSTTNITTIYSYLTDPRIPIKQNSAGNPDFFEWLDTQQCVLYVPIGSMSLYKTCNPWYRFINIIEFDTEGINNVLVDQSKKDIKTIYTIDGKEHIELQHGINIIKYENGKTEKVYVK